ncbi:MAG: pimeloyl-ACP methyl ester carboxylesterase [Oleiphilaceae bacterium]|jgi:pimeloyl-ACP methyl ester carboxylesterase
MANNIQFDNVEILVDGKGKQAILMLHGWPDNANLWDRQVDALKDNYRCIRFTLPGFDPKHERRTRTLDELIDFIQRVLDEVCPDEQVILMVHDWGCLFGYQFYNRFPDRVSKVIGVDIGDTISWEKDIPPLHQVAAYTYQAMLAACWKLGGKLGDIGSRSIAKMFKYPGPIEQVCSNMAYPYVMFRYAGKDSYDKNLTAFEPDCPFLFIYGALSPIDSFSRKWAENMEKKPSNRFVPFQTEHWVMLEQPEQFNQTIIEWLSNE